MVQLKVDTFRSLLKSIGIACKTEKSTIYAYWWESKNFGDALNPEMIRMLSGKEPVLISHKIWNIRGRPIYTVIGSILDDNHITSKSAKYSVIWGPGFISESGKLAGVPKEICAVRGPLSRAKILRQGIKCPEVYGDPALLLPKLYTPKTGPEYKLGIIPHFRDKDCNVLKRISDDPEVKIIDVEDAAFSVIEAICSCRYIASSSLHGIIIADAYGIPSTWIKLTEKVEGDGFKFKDYFASVGREDDRQLTLTENSTIDDIYGSFYKYKIDIDLDRLLEACPFKKACD